VTQVCYAYVTMSKLAFDYSKWDKLELSDDEETMHPGCDKNLNIRINRMTRDRKEDEIDEKKAELEAKGEFKEAEKVERQRPLHAGNVSRIAEERTIINQANGRSYNTTVRDEDSFSTDDYTQFISKHQDILEQYTETDWEKSHEMLLKYGDVLMEDYSNTYFMLTALDEEMQGNRKQVERLCFQSQIIFKIHELAKPIDRPPRDLIPRFFERFEKDEARGAFQQGVDNFIDGISKRAVEKKTEEAKRNEQEDLAARHARGELEKVSLVDAMHTMKLEDRMGPGGLDPVEVFDSLSEAMQTAFKTKDVESLQQIATEMDEQEFDEILQRCIDCGLWKDSS